MTQRIYLFNPDNDLALAHGGGHYIAPPFAQKMQNDLCALPMWYAEPGSMVLVADEAMCEWVDSTSERLGFTIKGITPALRKPTMLRSAHGAGAEQLKSVLSSVE